VALYRLNPSFSAEETHRQIQRYEAVFRVLPLTSAVVLEAVRVVQKHSFSYFDAQIWAVAKLAQIPVVLSEDFDVGSTIDGVSFVNPLRETFDLLEL